MKKIDSITQDVLRTLFHYEPETGVVRRLKTVAGNAKEGDVCGCPSNGYLVVRVNDVLLPIHRLVWMYVHGNWPEQMIDHIDGNRSNNKLSNLRDVSRDANNQNTRRARKNSRSGLLGVSFSTVNATNPWVASITSGGKQKRIGYYPSRELAYAAYLDAKRRLHVGCTI